MKTARRTILNILILSALIFMPFYALAQTAEDWNLSCPWKTKSQTTVYSAGEKGDVSELALRPVADTIPKNTYCQIVTMDGDNCLIAYMIGGEERSGFVARDDLKSAYMLLRREDGTVVNLHELLYNGGDAGKAEKGENVPLTVTAVSELPLLEKPSLHGETVLTVPKGEEVTIARLGLAWCQVIADRKKGFVPTKSLFFSGVAGGTPFAIVSTFRTGELTLWEKPAKGSFSLGTYQNGTLVTVLALGEAFTRVQIGKKAGYMQTDYLDFREACDPPEEEYVISYRGNDRVRTTVHLRAEPSGEARRIGEYKTGMYVTMFFYREDWCEIEVDGKHGYMQTEYLKKVNLEEQ